MMNLEKIIWRLLRKSLNIKIFMFISELIKSSKRLVDDYHHIAEFIDIGETRSGDPFQALILYGGDRDIVLAYAFPHPNEPIGSLTLDFLSWNLAKDKELLRKTNATWIIVKIADLYCAKLNEGWFKGGLDIKKYVLNYYRPPSYKQVEWMFPIKYKTLNWNKPTPETICLMKIIEE